MTHISPALAPFLPPSYLDANGNLSVSQSDAEHVATVVQQHVQSLPAAEAELFMALLQAPDLSPKNGKVPEDIDARLNSLEGAVKLVSDFLGLAEDVQLLAKLIIMHVNDQQKQALDNRIAAREEAKQNQLKQADEMRSSADKMLSGAITSLVLSVVSAAVSLGMAGASSALSARAAGRLNDMPKIAPPKVSTGTPPAPPNAQPSPLNTNSQVHPQVNPQGETTPGVTPQSEGTSTLNDGPEPITSADASQTTTSSTPPGVGEIAPGMPPSTGSVTPTSGGGSSQTGANGSGTGESGTTTPDGEANVGQTQVDPAQPEPEVDPNLKFHADMKGQELEMAQIGTISNKAQNFSTFGGIVSSLGQAGAGFASTESQSESKLHDAQGAVYAAAAEQANAAGDMAKSMQDATSELLNKIVQLLHDLQSTKVEQMSSFTRV